MKRFKTNLSSNDQWNLKSLKIAEHNHDKFSHVRKKTNKNRNKRSRIFTQELLVLYTREEVISKQ